MTTREEVLKSESAISTGGGVELTERERMVNKHLLKLKQDELKRGQGNAGTFTPSMHFFDAKPHIDQSQLFKFIQKLPKAACLHSHLSASISLDYIVQYISNAPNLYFGHVNGIFKLRFQAEGLPNFHEGWQPISVLKQQSSYEEQLKSKLTLATNNHTAAYPDINTTWSAFMQKFSTTYDMYTYKPFLKHITKIILQEFLKDNVTYVEFRIAPLQLYDFTNAQYRPSEFCSVLNEAILEFQSENDMFIGAKLIISPSRRLDDENMKKMVVMYKELKRDFPKLIAGFDLVGYEDLGRSLKDLSECFAGLSPSELFFHAGETNWYGTESDENIIDAVAMGCKRIGHGFSLGKHPEVMKLVKNKNIALEVMPISNQVLKMIGDLRNHPAAVFIAHGLPIVVANDDPSFFGSTGLSYDWYLVFLAMTRRDAGLDFLKQLAMNSINYSAMSTEEKNVANRKWLEQWDAFINNFPL